MKYNTLNLEEYALFIHSIELKRVYASLNSGIAAWSNLSI